MADKINFSQNINVSVQVGDTLYYTNVTGGAGNLEEIGPITEVGSNFVVVDGPIVTGKRLYFEKNLFYLP